MVMNVMKLSHNAARATRAKLIKKAENMNVPKVSFEFFPPQNLEASFRLWDTVQVLAPLDPTFVSVTYGAGGTTRDLTRDAVATLHKSSGLNVAAHLTCVNATKEETLAIAADFAKAGVKEIVALRGDAPKGQDKFTPCAGGFANSVELIEALIANTPFAKVVADPFNGSGTTLMACEKHRRVYRGLELDPAYVDVTVRRWEAFTGQQATLEGDGRTFAEVAAERVP